MICKNGKLAQERGLNVAKDCPLSIITNGEVVSKLDNPKNPDIVLAFYEYERLFGQGLKKTFALFDVFNGTQDLLFKVFFLKLFKNINF